MYARIIVDIANENVDRLYTYKLGIQACVGQRVLVPFGRGDKMTEGFILDISPESSVDPDKLKSVIKTLEDYPVIDKTQIELASWIKKTYHCTMSQALRLMIPAQLRGMRIKEKQVRCVSVKDVNVANAYMEKLISKNGKIRSQGAYDALGFLLQSDTVVSVADLTAIIPGCTTAVIKRLTDAGILEQSYRTIYRRPKTMPAKKAEEIVLTSEQQNALAKIRYGIEKRKGTYLIHGVTGSGKTEVYMQAISDVIASGRGAIVLVPEISLTPQTVQRFTERFGQRVAVLHSRLSAGERFDEWRRIRLGMVDVAVGARSAVFAPIADVGMIIIDEEHETSYASETVPRYSALDAAQKRCSLSGGVMILGSATPSVTTYFRSQIGKYELIEMKNRVNSHPLPTVEIVDMRAEFMSGNSSIFSEKLKDRLNECLAAGEQAILFLNRRGYSNFVACRACGYIWKCTDCDVSMTYHKADHKLKCHYCGNESDVPTTCPNCGKSYVKFQGFGTEHIETELKRLFPDVRCIRMDADTTREKDAHMKLLSAFSSGQANVLIGTQMIAKGLDFPNVTLVGIMSVDAMLAMPDFRNTERTFQLLTQVSGRAGRADKPGEVILQTSNPDHPIIEFAKEHDYTGFYAYAIQNRQTNLFPPFSVFVRVLFASEDENTSYEEAVSFSDKVYAAMCGVLRENGQSLSEIAFIYSMPAPISKLRGLHRAHVIMKLARTKNTKQLIDTVYECADAFDGKSLSCVEINPNDML